MKMSIVCRGINNFTLDPTVINSHTPIAGDVALFRVIELGKHTSIQGPNGNNCYLFPGDEFLAVFGNRYATEQFEGYVPSHPCTTLDILGKGGVVGLLKSMHVKFDKIGSTKVELLAYAKDTEGKVANTIQQKPMTAIYDPSFIKASNTRVILSLGGSMDSGKTTTAAFACRSLMQQGTRAGYVKLTGTFYTKDKHFVKDCGAAWVADFGVLGYPSTYMLEMFELLQIYQHLFMLAETQNLEVLVMEIADGIYQRETRMLLENEEFRSTVSGTLFSAVDSLGAIQGIQFLTSLGLQPMFVSGLHTASPLLQNEVSQLTKIPVLNLEEILEYRWPLQYNNAAMQSA